MQYPGIYDLIEEFRFERRRVLLRDAVDFSRHQLHRDKRGRSLENVDLASSSDSDALRFDERLLTIDEVPAASATIPNEFVVRVSMRSTGSAIAFVAVYLVGPREGPRARCRETRRSPSEDPSARRRIARYEYSQSWGP